MQAIPVLITALTRGRRLLSGLSRRANFRPAHALAAGSVGSFDFGSRHRRHRQARMAPRHGATHPQGVTPEKLRLGLVLAIFSSVGFESATSLGSEARDPLVSIPRAVKWSAILAGVFFFLCAYAVVWGFAVGRKAWARARRPCMCSRSRWAFRRWSAHSPIWRGRDIFLVLSGLHHCGGSSALSHGPAWRAALRAGQAHEENQTPHRAVL